MCGGMQKTGLAAVESCEISDSLIMNAAKSTTEVYDPKA